MCKDRVKTLLSACCYFWEDGQVYYEFGSFIRLAKNFYRSVILFKQLFAENKPHTGTGLILRSG